MATGTVVSRITGIARDIALAAALGFYLVSDAYSLGNSLPTIIYILVVGGALNAVFIPQLVRRMEKDDDGGNAYADRLITLTGAGVVGRHRGLLVARGARGPPPPPARRPIRGDEG